MKKYCVLFLLGVCPLFTLWAQQAIIKGNVKDANAMDPLPNVTVSIEGTNFISVTDALGEFSFAENLPQGEYVLSLSKQGYISNSHPFVVSEDATINIADIVLELDLSETVDLFTITLSDDELNDDIGGADNISGLLQSSKDVFQRTAAFEFSSSFFRVRGLDSENGTVLINGVKMNKQYNGRPQWSNWGGLNDVLRNQELSSGLAPSEYTFGGVLGTTNINVRASSYREGGRLTYSSSNRSYTNRIMANYASGLTKGNWAYAVMIGRRWGKEGYQDATFYDANSFFASVEKKLNEKHSLNLTGIYAPNRRGKSSPNTQEVYDLKGTRYNEYWGWQDGEKRNSRVKRVVEPIIMLNHYWDISDKTKLNTNVAYQFGEMGNSRLDYNGTRLNSDGISVGGGSNPSPTYYQKLPSFWLGLDEGPNQANADLSEQEFLDNGQIDWTAMYRHNVENTGGYSTYVLYEDRSDNTQWTFNTILSSDISENIMLNGGVKYGMLKSENFAEIVDLLGGNGYLDIDSFEDNAAEEPSDVQNPYRIAGEDEKFKYNYNLLANVISGYAQGVFKYNKVDFHVAASITNTSYQREGLYQNGGFPDHSLGKGEELTFTGIGAKGGFTYKASGKHLFDVNAGYLTKAPSLRNTYPNVRENHTITEGITEEKILTADASYIFRSPVFKAKLTGFYIKGENATDIAFYYSQGATVNAFIQEVMTSVNKKHIGAELGVEAQVTPTIKLKGAASFGQYTYDNNPDLYVYSEDYVTSAEDNPENVNISGIESLGKANMKNYKLASGPQKAYSFGIEYRDPHYWWVGATANYFTDIYLDVSPILRTSSFSQDADGVTFDNYDETVARQLLKQEKFEEYMTVNLIGGKSWKIDDYYVGFFASVNNLLDEVFKTGGYEQGRYSDYRTLKEDVDREKRFFGPKYWYGRGATYFVNVYVRF